jgi:hypothetical protein
MATAIFDGVGILFLERRKRCASVVLLCLLGYLADARHGFLVAFKVRLAVGIKGLFRINRFRAYRPKRIRLVLVAHDAPAFAASNSHGDGGVQIEWLTAKLAQMVDDDNQSAPIPFVVGVTANRTRMQVTLLLRPGTAH